MLQMHQKPEAVLWGSLYSVIDCLCLPTEYGRGGVRAYSTGGIQYTNDGCRDHAHVWYLDICHQHGSTTPHKGLKLQHILRQFSVINSILLQVVSLAHIA